MNGVELLFSTPNIDVTQFYTHSVFRQPTQACRRRSPPAADFEVGSAPPSQHRQAAQRQQAQARRLGSFGHPDVVDDATLNAGVVAAAPMDTADVGEGAGGRGDLQHVVVRDEGGRVLIDNDLEVDDMLGSAARERVLVVGVRHVGHIDIAVGSDVHCGPGAKEAQASLRRGAAGVDEHLPAEGDLLTGCEATEARGVLHPRETALLAVDGVAVTDLAGQAGGARGDQMVHADVPALETLNPAVGADGVVAGDVTVADLEVLFKVDALSTGRCGQNGENESKNTGCEKSLHLVLLSEKVVNGVELLFSTP